VTRQSGKWKGESRIRSAPFAGAGGHARQTRFMPAVAADRVDAEMRKLVVRANALPCNDRPRTPQPDRPTRIL